MQCSSSPAEGTEWELVFCPLSGRSGQCSDFQGCPGRSWDTVRRCKAKLVPAMVHHPPPWAAGPAKPASTLSCETKQSDTNWGVQLALHCHPTSHVPGLFWAFNFHTLGWKLKAPQSKSKEGGVKQGWSAPAFPTPPQCHWVPVGAEPPPPPCIKETEGGSEREVGESGSPLPSTSTAGGHRPLSKATMVMDRGS